MSEVMPFSTIYEDVAALQEQVAALQAATADTGWINLTLQDGIVEHNASKFPARCRRIGKLVRIEGAINGITVASTTVAILPEGFRPSKNLYYIGARNGGETDTYELGSNGHLVLVDSSTDTYIASNYHFINTTFVID